MVKYICDKLIQGGIMKKLYKLFIQFIDKNEMKSRPPKGRLFAKSYKSLRPLQSSAIGWQLSLSNLGPYRNH